MKKIELVKQDIMNTATSLIKHRSIASSVEEQNACLQLIADEFSDILVANFFKYNGHPALVLSTSQAKESDILISGHIDVVDGPDELFQPVLKDGKLIGRGAYDMKAPLAAALHSVRDAIAQGMDETVSIMITADEETCGDGTRYLLDNEGYKAKLALIPDGGNENSIIISQKGFTQIAIVVRGRSGHASRPWQAINPVTISGQIVNWIAKMYPHPSNEEDWRTTYVTTKITTPDTALNKIPASATIFVDIRYVDPEDVGKFITTLTEQWGDDLKIEVVTENGMLSTAPDSDLVNTLSSSITKIVGLAPILTKECGTSDAIFFTEHDIPAVLYRPNGGGEHSDLEWVDVDSLMKTYMVFKEFLLRPKN